MFMNSPELQRELMRLAVLGSSLLLVLALILAIAESPMLALRWLPAALACWVIVVWQCHQRLHLNHSTDGAKTRFRTLGLGTRVTLLRGLLIAATAGFLTVTAMQTRPVLLFLPALLYTAAALGDALDGYLARRQRHTSCLGSELDTSLDALGLLIAPLLAVLYGKLHVSYLLVSAAYYFFHWGIHWRQHHGKPVYELMPSTLRRHLAGLQMALVATVLWPPLPADTTQIFGVIFMIPMLTGFWRDWLQVSGRRKTDREPAA